MFGKSFVALSLATLLQAEPFCTPGTYLLNNQCENVPLGCYQTQPNASEYFACPTGHTCSDPAELPQICSPGTFAPFSGDCFGHIECTQVPHGCYQSQAGQDHFEACPAEHYCPDSSLSPVPCPEGMFSSSSPMCAPHSKCYESED